MGCNKDRAYGTDLYFAQIYGEMRGGRFYSLLIDSSTTEQNTPPSFSPRETNMARDATKVTNRKVRASMQPGKALVVGLCRINPTERRPGRWSEITLLDGP
jgi:hypothetical protein